MGPLGVVGCEPGLGDRANLLERIEEIGVEHLFAVCPVEALDEGILIGLAGLNVAETDPLRRTPFDEGLGDELRAVVTRTRAGRRDASPATTARVLGRAQRRRYGDGRAGARSEEHTSELQSRPHLVC